MEKRPFDFDAIRPYEGEEVPKVLAKLTERTSLFVMMAVFFPELTPQQLVQDMLSIQNTEEFQKKYIGEALRRMIVSSSDTLQVHGFEHISPDETYLFVANHRDIILDPGIFNERRYQHGFPTTLIAIGDNLLSSSLVTDLMKLNKSFIVHRSVPRNQLFKYSERLSHYIRENISQGKDSVWIAQRSGRAKDGNDKTQTALLKMLNISGEGELIDNFKSLRIVPVAISYEYEPCDMFKTEELVHKQLDLPYVKDDKMAIIRGIRDFKGRIQMNIGQPISPGKYSSLGDPQKRQRWFTALASLLDQEIQALYRLWPTHYIAHDILEESNVSAAHYSDSDKERFLGHIEKRMAEMKGPEGLLWEQLLKIYAQPVYNHYAG